MNVVLPDPSLVLLVGPSGCGKSTFAGRHFAPTEIVSSDHYRAVVSDREDDMSASSDAFALVHAIVRKRLVRGRLTVVDATNLLASSRRTLIGLAKTTDRPAIALVFDVGEQLCIDRNRARPRAVPADVVRRHAEDLRRSLPELAAEGFARLFVLASPEQVDAAVVERHPAVVM